MAKFFFQSWTQNLGRNGWDQPQAIPEDMSAESYNIELREGGLGKKRRGSSTVTVTGTAIGVLDTTISRLSCFIPRAGLSAAELFILTGNVSAISGHVYRVAGGAAATDLTLDQNIDTEGSTGTFATLDNKFYMATGTQDRLQVFVPDESTTSMRVVGLASGGAPTVADFGVGTYPPVIRYYRIRFRAKVGGVVVRTSEASSSTPFTPTGVSAAARITQGTAPNEGETHWVIEGSQDDTVFWELYEVGIATTTYDDSNNPPNYPSIGLVPPLIGECYPFPPCKYIMSDGVRLYGLGRYVTSSTTALQPKTGRLFFTPAIGSSDLGDTERCVNTSESSGWIDVSIGAGGEDRGIAGPINGSVYVFQDRGIFMFSPTGNSQTPLRRTVISNVYGAVSQESIVLAEDENGVPCLYFLDPKDGPRRITAEGNNVQWLGKDVKDIWNTITTSVLTLNLSWGCYDQSAKLIYWAIPTGSATQPSEFIVYDVTNGRAEASNSVRRGWTRWEGPDTASKCACSFPSTLDATRPASETVYFALNNGVTIGKFVESASNNLGSTFGSHVQSKAYLWRPVGRLKRILEAVVVAKARAATTLYFRLIGNWGEKLYDQTLNIAPTGTETYVRPRPNPEDMTDLVTAQIRIGDLGPFPIWEVESAEIQVEDLEQTR